MPNGYIKQACVKDFIVNSLILKYANMFERMEISENIYEGGVETSYFKKILE